MTPEEGGKSEDQSTSLLFLSFFLASLRPSCHRCHKTCLEGVSLEVEGFFKESCLYHLHICLFLLVVPVPTCLRCLSSVLLIGSLSVRLSEADSVD